MDGLLQQETVDRDRNSCEPNQKVERAALAIRAELQLRARDSSGKTWTEALCALLQSVYWFVICSGYLQGVYNHSRLLLSIKILL